MKYKLWKTLSGAALAASLVLAPVVASGANAAAIVGEIGDLQPATAEANDPAYWQKLYGEHQPDCYSHDGGSDHGNVTDGGLTVTLNPFKESWPGDHWELLVVKAGSTNNVIVHPEAGVAYASPVNRGAQQAEVSHWIVCKGKNPDDTTTSVTPSLTYTPPTCEADGTLTRSTNVDWTSTPSGGGTTLWTASAFPGEALAERVQREWLVPDLTRLLAEEVEACRTEQPEPEQTSIVSYDYDCESETVITTTVTTTTPYIWDGKTWAPGEPTDETTTATRPMNEYEKAKCPPDTEVEEKAWVDGVWACGDTAVTQTREVVTTVYTMVEGVPVPTTTTATETRVRDLTQEEISECPLVPGTIRSVCVSDVPYLGYEVTPPEGYTPASENPVTITFVNPDGDDYVVTGQPLAGTILWPGASDAEPKMWPGWALVDGEYVETDGNYAWTRNGVTVRFDINPTYSTVVAYPQATALCANPASDDPHALAVTGGGVSPLVPIAGGAALVLGLGALAFVAYRRRTAAE